MNAIPVIDIAPLYGADTAARRAVDAAINQACREIGFLVVTGQEAAARLDAARRQALTRFFALPSEAKRLLARRKYAPENTRAPIYRGYFYPLNGVAAYKEGIDLGPDFADDDPVWALGHPLVERNPWPPDAALPGWRGALLDYRAAVERVGFRLLHSLARGLGLAEGWFDDKFRGGNSTLRLLHYPPRPPESLAGYEDKVWREYQGQRYAITTGEHCDSGCLTLLHQDGVGGLQARHRDGTWLDVPAIEGSLVINLGDLMQRWTNDLFVATEHRVLGFGPPRESIPFFFEPRVDAVIDCLPGYEAVGTRRRPVVYGDYLIVKSQRFPEFRGFLPMPEGFTAAEIAEIAG